MIIERQTRHGWVFLLRGVIFLILGVWVVYTPVGSYRVFSFLVGLGVLAAGITELMHAMVNRHLPFSWFRMIAGIVDLALGILLATHLAMQMAVLPYVAAVFFLVRGLSLATLAPAVRGFLWMLFGGLTMVFFAAIIALNPVYGVITIARWLGLGFVVAGIVNIWLSIRLLSVNRRVGTGA